MSKLSEFQIRALIPGMEATAARLRAAGRTGLAATTELKIEEYRRELRGRIAQVSSSPALTHLVATKALEKLLKIEQFKGEAMDKKENALAHVEVGPEESMDLWKWVGRQQAFGMMSAKASQAQAQCLKRMKDGGEYKALGLTWEQFCNQHVGVSRASADRIIANYEEFGAAYFALSSVTRISAGQYRLIAGAVDEGHIEIEGEKIAITKANAGRISEAIASLTKTVEQRDEQLAEKKREATKFKGERDSASKAAERARAELVEFKRQQTALFAGAGSDEDYRTLLEAQSYIDMGLAKLATVYKRELSDENQARYIGLTDYAYRGLVQASFEARDKYGAGFNLAEPGELLAMETVAPNPRNLIQEMGAKKDA